MPFRLRFPRYPKDHDSLETVNVSQLPESEKWRIEHARLHEKHRGHEALHGEVGVVVLVSLLLAQLAIMLWKRRHYSSYQRATLVGMWLVPMALCVRWAWTRFLWAWVLFSTITAVLCRRASRRPLAGTTPRWVYKWFLLVDKVSYVLGIVGYLVVLCSLVGVNVVFVSTPQEATDAGLLLMFYGLYFGLVARDVAQVCTDTMAAHIGYWSSTGLPCKRLEEDVCAVCGNQVLLPANTHALLESTVRLNCHHIFHEFCIRGWCIVGKKETCPYCKEKVDLRHMFGGRWGRGRVLYGALLGWIRYLVSWQPVIFLLLQARNWMLGQE
ncbi:E3 ubiquitin ligase RNF121-like [Babylonia areolata]|uniref:E3 ubiquitin ligase RNF121-like n=1 Tax=Babylonia areolata TaxID=304850 RepID=UPI003FD40DD9